MGGGIEPMGNKFLTYILGNKHERQAVDRLHEEIVRSSNKAVVTANALESTIKEMIERKKRLGRFNNETPHKGT